MHARTCLSFDLLTKRIYRSIGFLVAIKTISISKKKSGEERQWEQQRTVILGHPRERKVSLLLNDVVRPPTLIALIKSRHCLLIGV